MHSYTSMFTLSSCDQGSSSDSDEMSMSDEEDEDGPTIPACTPLASFLSFKHEAEKRRASQVHLETTGKVVEVCHHLDELFIWILGFAGLLNFICVLSVLFS